MEIKIDLLSPKAFLPAKATEGSAGYDLYACLEKPALVWPGHIAVIPTGIRVQIPRGYEMQIRTRSGMAKKGLVVANSPGTVDSDFRGEVCVLIYNLNPRSANPLSVQPGDRIAQAVFSQVEDATWILCKDLDNTERNTGGFGSTGV